MAETVKRGMTVARATETEIKQVRDFLNELGFINRYFHNEALFAIKQNSDEFEVLSKFRTDEPENFIEDICRYVDNIRHECVLFNLTTLMDNCADLELDHLDFNSKLKRGLELVELENNDRIKIL